MDRCHMAPLIFLEVAILESTFPKSGSWGYVGVLYHGTPGKFVTRSEDNWVQTQLKTKGSRATMSNFLALTQNKQILTLRC